MHDRQLAGLAGGRWRILAEPHNGDVHVAPVPNEQLRRSSADDEADWWESIGGRPCFTVDCSGQGQPLAPGWYELSGYLQASRGKIVLPSLHPYYVKGSALASGELTLRAPDASGRITALLMFFDEVQTLAFYPSICPAQFRMHDFSLRKVSRSRALLDMLGDPRRDPRGPGAVRRAAAWARNAMRYGLKRAADEIYADYRQRLRPPGLSDYDIWTRKYDTIGELELAAFRRRASALAGRAPLISILLPVHDVSERWLRRCLDSLLEQVHDYWELCVADNTAGASQLAALLAEYAQRDARIRVVRCERSGREPEASNTALAMASGEFITLLDPVDELRPHALLRIAEAVVADPRLALVYSDDDRIDADGKRFDPDFKPDWNPDLLRSQNYLSRLVAIRTTLAREAGGFRPAFGDNQDYDLILGCIERIEPHQIRHIPEILYHRRMIEGSSTPARSAVEGVFDTGGRAVTEHLARTGTGAQVVPADRPAGLYHIRWPLPDPAPKISLIIPTRDRAGLLRMCVESILAKSTYPDFELVVVDNQSQDGDALDYLRELGTRKRVRVLHYDAPFNYSAINNWAARQCDGRLLGLVNNDIEVISPDWLEEMAGFVVRPDTGAVGAMLYYPDDTIQHAGVLLGMLGLAGHINCRMLRGYAGHAGRGLVAQNLSAVTGACLLVRREVFEEVGGLDEKLAVAFNDIDFCLRVRERGYRNVWTPFAEMYHHESASRGIDDTDAKRSRYAGEIEFMMKRWGPALREDPAYNPNLSLQTHNFELAFPPRETRRVNAIDGDAAAHAR